MLGDLLNTATPLLVAATEGTDEGLSPLVRVVPGLMIWTILAFGVSMLILKKYAWPPISKLAPRRRSQRGARIRPVDRGKPLMTKLGS